MSDLSSVHRQQRDDLLSPATQIVRNRADYLGEGLDVGHRVADDKLELFVKIDPAQALLQQFAQSTPEFIVLHDVGGSHSLRLLNAVAGALKSKVQQLAIRREGHGVALAVLPFVEMPGRGALKLRVYCTDIDTDSATRRQLSAVLLGHARLGVMMVSEMPAHAMTKALQPTREALAKGPWPNRELLLIPLGSPATLAAESASLVGPRGLRVQVTPRAAAPTAAWGFVTGAWNRLRESATPHAQPQRAQPADDDSTLAMPMTPAADRALPVPAQSAAPARATMHTPAAGRAQSPVPAPAPAASAPAAHPEAAAAPSSRSADIEPGRWSGYLQACQGIKGLVSACVFDFRSVRVLAHEGARPDADKLLRQGVNLFGALAESGRALGLGPSQPDAAITLTGHHLLLHPLPGHPGIILHAVLDASIANLTLARMQLQRVDTAELGVPPSR
jgi:hypothetical protein